MTISFENKEHRITLSRNNGNVSLKIQDIKTSHEYQNNNIEIDTRNTYDFMSREISNYMSRKNKRFIIEINNNVMNLTIHYLHLTFEIVLNLIVNEVKECFYCKKLTEKCRNIVFPRKGKPQIKAKINLCYNCYDLHGEEITYEFRDF